MARKSVEQYNVRVMKCPDGTVQVDTIFVLKDRIRKGKLDHKEWVDLPKSQRKAFCEALNMIDATV